MKGRFLLRVDARVGADESLTLKKLRDVSFIGIDPH